MTKQKIYSFILLFSSLIFYLFFAIYDGVVICVDSPSYINMHLSREPFYPVFLAVLRCIFRTGNNFYLVIAVFLQSILAALAAFMLTDFLRKEQKLSFYVSCIIMAVPLAVSFLCRFAAKRASMYSNSILTEGIACSLFLIFIRYLLEYCYHQNVKSLLIAGILSFILIATRKQMYLTLFLLVISIAYVSIKAHRLKAGVLTVMICILSILACNRAFDSVYVYSLCRTAGTHSGDNRFLSTMVFYVSEKEDFKYIKDDDLCALAEQIYMVCDEEGWVKHDSGKGWYNRVNHFGDSYDHIQIDTMWPAIEHYVRDAYDGNEVVLEKQVDAYTNEIIVSILPHVWTGILATFTDNFLSGLIITVAQFKPFFIVYSMLVYLVYIILLLINIKKEGFNLVSILALLTLISILLNVAIISGVIFCQFRYTIYNMPLFYISLWLLFHNLSKKAIYIKLKGTRIDT